MPKYIIEVTDRWLVTADSPQQATEKYEVTHEGLLMSETEYLPEDWFGTDDEVEFLDGTKFIEEESNEE